MPARERENKKKKASVCWIFPLVNVCDLQPVKITSSIHAMSERLLYQITHTLITKVTQTFEFGLILAKNKIVTPTAVKYKVRICAKCTRIN